MWSAISAAAGLQSFSSSQNNSCNVRFALKRQAAFSFHEPEFQLLHASLVRVDHPELELSRDDYGLALDGQMPAGLDDEPCDGLGVIIAELRPELLVEVLDGGYA